MRHTAINRVLLTAMTAATLMGLYGVVNAWNAMSERPRVVITDNP